MGIRGRGGRREWRQREGEVKRSEDIQRHKREGEREKGKRK